MIIGIILIEEPGNRTIRYLFGLIPVVHVPGISNILYNIDRDDSRLCISLLVCGRGNHDIKSRRFVSGSEGLRQREVTSKLRDTG